jgi:hypothetical protein
MDKLSCVLSLYNSDPILFVDRLPANLHAWTLAEAKQFREEYDAARRAIWKMCLQIYTHGHWQRRSNSEKTLRSSTRHLEDGIKMRSAKGENVGTV